MITLQRTDATALSFITKAEAAARAQGFVSGWSEARHRRALAAPDTAYFRIVTMDGARTVGYAIVRGLEPDPVNIELKRLVVTEPGQGYGRVVLRRMKALAFDELGAHRLWLDVFVDNARARHLYSSEGFVEEGVMRESGRRDDGYASQVLMSVLAHEYRRD
ncbi:MAG TPA: GNAT family N-acetyltransferase [Oleiagrimonas sp.]|nr:GNAT family N-acetyltransferase [Oleiagrimonas sp.]